MTNGSGIDDVEFEAAILRSARRRRLGLMAVGLAGALALVALVGPSLWQSGRDDHPGGRRAPEHALTAAQRAQIVAAIAASRAMVESQDGRWRASIELVDPALVVPEMPTCRALDDARHQMIHHPQGWNGVRLFELPISQFKAGSSASLGSTPFPLDMVARGRQLPMRSPAARARLRELDELTAALDRSAYETFETRLSRATFDRFRVAVDVLLVLDEVREPATIPGGRGFVAGAIVARAWVFDHRSDAVTCAGVVRAVSSTAIDTGSSNLNDDLLINLVRAIPDQVRRTGPP